MQKIEESAKVNAYLNSGNQLKQKGKRTEAIDQYNKALESDPDNIPVLSQLADICESLGQIDQAITYYRRIVKLHQDDANARTKLAGAIMGKGNIEQAVAQYQKALALPNPPVEVYQRLGDWLLKQGNIQKAMSLYQTALTFPHPPAEVYQGLGNALEANGKPGQAIIAYTKAIKLKVYSPQLYLRLAQISLKKLRSLWEKAIAPSKNTQQTIKDSASSQDKGIYLKIWETLNQLDLSSIAEENFDVPKKLDSREIERYFTETSQYKTINLSSLNEEDKQAIERAGLSLEYLKLNQLGAISQEGVISEKLTVSELAEQLNFSLQGAEAIQRNRFQLTAIADGHIYAVCPSTGKILASNRSLVLQPQKGYGCIFYRFVGNEIFYLVTGGHWNGFSKLYLYFPKTELIVVLFALPLADKQWIFNRFKTIMVANCKKIQSYLLKTGKPEIVTLVSWQQFAHHLWNELAGIHKLYKANLLNEVDRFLAVAEPLGQIDRIFPEIPSEKIQRIQEDLLFEEVLENNYFVTRVGHSFIQQELANRLYETSLKQCHPSFLAEVEEAKKKFFPLLWISIRLNNRTWVSQTEGIANIIKKLSEHFPNLGVVIDGFSLPCSFSKSLAFQETIERETKMVRNIRSLLPSEIKIYDTVGCMLYESIVWAYAIDCYLAHYGTIQHKVGWTANKPGIVHTNRQTLKRSDYISVCSWARENSVMPIFIPESHITDVVENVKKDSKDSKINLNNYDCDWRVMYEELFKLASSIKRN
jgi:tetratricopeptide (TPR) repeat protein